MNDLEERLHDTGSDLVLRTPLTEITGRGRTLRQRRRTRRASLAAAASVTAVGGALVVANAISPNDTSQAPDPGDLVQAGWSSSLNGLPADDLAVYTALCRDFGNDVVDNVPVAATDVFNSAPVASTSVAGATGDLAVLVFHSGGAFADCIVDPDAPAGPSVTMLKSLPRMAETGAHVTSTGSYGSSDLSIATGLTSPEVATVLITIDGTPIRAAVEGGVFAVLVPPDASRQTLLGSTVTAYDASGTQLEEVPLLPSR